MFRRSPFTLANNRQARAVDDEMKACPPWNAPKREVEVLATTGQRRVIRRPKVEPHQHEEGREKALCLTERQMEEKAQRQGGFDCDVRVLPLGAPHARSLRFPSVDGLRGQPDGDVASADQGTIIGGPVPDVVLCLIGGMDSRLHPSSLVCRLRNLTPDSCTNACAGKARSRGTRCRDVIFETLFETLWVSNPIRPRSAASRNRVMRGPGVTQGAKRSQGARRPRD